MSKDTIAYLDKCLNIDHTNEYEHGYDYVDVRHIEKNANMQETYIVEVTESSEKIVDEGVLDDDQARAVRNRYSLLFDEKTAKEVCEKLPHSKNVLPDNSLKKWLRRYFYEAIWFIGIFPGNLVL